MMLRPGAKVTVWVHRLDQPDDILDYPGTLLAYDSVGVLLDSAELPEYFIALIPWGQVVRIDVRDDCGIEASVLAASVSASS